MSGLWLVLLGIAGSSIVLWAILDGADKKRRKKEDGTRGATGDRPRDSPSAAR